MCMFFLDYKINMFTMDNLENATKIKRCIIISHLAIHWLKIHHVSVKFFFLLWVYAHRPICANPASIPFCLKHLLSSFLIKWQLYNGYQGRVNSLRNCGSPVTQCANRGRDMGTEGICAVEGGWSQTWYMLFCPGWPQRFTWPLSPFPYPHIFLGLAHEK
jgi:hypothetical protein